VARALKQASETIPVEVVEAAKKFAENMTAVVSLIEPGIKALAALADFVPGPEIKTMVAGFAARMKEIAEELGAVALTVDKVLLAAAVEFSGALTAIADAVSKGMTVLTEMKAWKIVKDISEQMYAFKKLWIYIIEEFHGLYKATIEFLDEDVTKFAAALVEIAEALSRGLEVLTKIDEFVAPTEQAVTKFMEAIADLFMAFYNWIAGQGVWDGQGANLEEASLLLVEAFGSALGSLMGGLSAAADLVLVGWQAPTPSVWTAFSAWVIATFDEFYEHVIGKEYDEDELALFSAWAAALSSLMSGLTAAAEFVLDRFWMPPPRGAWSRFTAWVKAVFDEFYNYVIGQDYDTDGLALFSAWSAALSSLMTGLSAAAQFELERFWMPPPSGAWSRFSTWVKDVFKEFYDYVIGQDYDDKKLALVGAWAGALSSLMTGLTAAAAFELNKDWVSPDRDTFWNKFMLWVNELFNAIYVWLTIPHTAVGTLVYTDGGLAIVTAWGGALSSIMTGLTAAAAFELNKDWVSPDRDTFWNKFMLWVNDLFHGIYVWLTVPHTGPDGNIVYTDAGLAVVSAWGGALSSVMGGLSAALAIVDDVSGFVSPGTGPDSVWGKFTAWAQSVFDSLHLYITTTYPSTPEEAQDFAPVTAWGQALSAVMGGLASALEFVQDLPDFDASMTDMFEPFKKAVTDAFNSMLSWIEGKDEGQDGVGITEAQMTITTSLGTAFQSLFQGLTNAVDFLKGVGVLFHPTHDKLLFFLGEVKLTFTEMEAYAAGFTEDQRLVVEQFGKAMSDLISGLTSALTFIGKLEGTPLPELGGEHADSYFEKKVSHFLDVINVVVQRIKNWVDVEFKPEVAAVVKGFSDELKGLVDGLLSALNFMTQLQEADLPSIDKLQQYLDLIELMFTTFTSGVEDTPGDVAAAGAGVQGEMGTALANMPASSEWQARGADYTMKLADGLKKAQFELFESADVIRAAMASFIASMPSVSIWHELGYRYVASLAQGIKGNLGLIYGTDASALNLVAARLGMTWLWMPNPQNWYTVGMSYMVKLADGLKDGIPLVVAELQRLLGLLPQSPAEWGPFSEMPEPDWVGTYMGETQANFDAGLAGLSGLSAFTLPDMAGAEAGVANGSGGVSITVNLNGTTMRSDDDVRLLAQSIFDEVRTRAGIW